MNQHINEWMNQSINKSINQWINISMNEWINQSINQLINESTLIMPTRRHAYKLYKHYSGLFCCQFVIIINAWISNPILSVSPVLSVFRSPKTVDFYRAAWNADTV